MWPDGVIPFGMERVALDVEGSHFGVGDFDAFFVQVVVEFAANREACLGRCRRDQFDDRQPAGQGPTPPILRNRAEQAVFDLVPLGCAGRIMADGNGQARLVGELLQFDLP